MKARQKYLDNLIAYIDEKHLNVYDICCIDGDETFYKRITPASIATNSYSVSKSFTATLIGMLIVDNKLSMESKIFPFFKDYFKGEYDKAWEQVTVKDLLIHTSGQKTGNLFEEDVLGEDEVDLTAKVFKEKLFYTPGEKFTYSNIGGYLLAQVFEKVTKQDYVEYIRRNLFEPLDFRHFAITTCQKGHPMGATGLILRTVDLAKYGYTYAMGGKYNGKQIIPESWTEIAKQNAFKVSDELSYTYGNFWRLNGEDACFGDGRNGQLCYIDSKNKFCIAVHSYLAVQKTLDLVKAMKN